jgi:hypothetical protein
MAVTITVAGIDRTSDIQHNSFNIQQILTYQEDTIDFTVKSGGKPSNGQEIVVTSGTTRIFAGIIDGVKADEQPGGIRRWNCTARDYTYQFNAKLVADIWENVSASDIVEDIIDRYTTGFTKTGVDSGAPNVEWIFFDYEKPAECLKKLAEYVGWEWYIDYNRNVQFFDPATRNTPAPLTVEDGNDVRKWKHNVDEQGLVNRVYVLGGSMLSDPTTFEFKADGVQTVFPLAHKPHKLSMAIGGAPVVSGKLGVENLNEDDGTYDYLMNYQEKYVRNGLGTSIIAAGTTVAFTYQYDIPVITMVEDLESQAAVAAVQGGDGVYEHKIKDDSLTTLEAAEAAGQAYLKEHANPRVIGSFATAQPGWEPGQILTVDSASRGISGTFTVQKVKISTYGTGLLYTIEYGGRIKGLEAKLKAIVSAQQASRNKDTVIITKIKANEDEIIVGDSSSTTLRRPPYVAGDADALAGFVVATASPLMAGGLAFYDFWVAMAEYGMPSIAEDIIPRV